MEKMRKFLAGMMSMVLCLTGISTGALTNTQEVYAASAKAGTWGSNISWKITGEKIIIP